MNRLLEKVLIGSRDIDLSEAFRVLIVILLCEMSRLFYIYGLISNDAIEFIYINVHALR